MSLAESRPKIEEMPQAFDPFSPLTLIEKPNLGLAGGTSGAVLPGGQRERFSKRFAEEKVSDPPVGLVGIYTSRNHTAIVLKSMDVSLR